jgi:hypothetical protein
VLGEVLADQGKLAEAVALLGRAALKLEDAAIEWFYARKRMCDWAGYREDEARARKAAGKQAFPLLALCSSPAEQLDCARRAAAARVVPKSLMCPRAMPRPGGRIRVGYVSANFRPHAGASLIVGLIEQHDRRDFEIIGYSARVDDGSQLGARLASAFDRFVDISSTGDRDAAWIVRNDGIDILVDLNGFTERGRTAILAYRPAPIQVNYLGFPGTAGADFIDYIIVDPFVVPADQQEFFRERLVHLPDCYQCNDDRRVISKHTPSRAQCGLPKEGFVFCCFNNAYKITPDFFDIWMRLLAAVPGSSLWLLDDNPWEKENLSREAAARGIAPERIVFAPKLPAPDHLARHRLADLFLDTLPLQCSYDGQRRLVGRAAARDLRRRHFCRPGGGKPVAGDRARRTRDRRARRVRGSGAAAGARRRPACGVARPSCAKSTHPPAVRYRTLRPEYRGRLPADVGYMESRGAACGVFRFTGSGRFLDLEWVQFPLQRIRKTLNRLDTSSGWGSPGKPHRRAHLNARKPANLNRAVA